MKLARFIFPVLLWSLASSACADNIYSLIRQGRLKEAADSLSGVSTASTRDGNLLFFRSLLEENADRAAQLMEAALKTSVAAVYRQEIYYRLAQYNFLAGDYTRLAQLVSEYRAFWEAGKYRQEMLRFSILIDERNRAYDAGIRQADRYLLEYNSGSAYQWGIIDKARLMRGFDKNVAAHRLLRGLSREKSGPGVAPALYLLATEAIAEKNTDNAVFYYNLLREGYPAAVGLETLVSRMGVLSHALDDDNQAERITGTYYSVQVGVFSVKGNANRQADMFKAYDRKIEIKQKKISDVKYHVVYVGRFTNYEEARKFKTMLEANHNEVYQVVAR
ncbi:MAG: SPOR domain-containing protein [Candidatus Zixiibacteriota bacterium]|nr:MAG: SPOR domain-containing protein [candidate division Zixibacteria bacterium]